MDICKGYNYWPPAADHISHEGAIEQHKRRTTVRSSTAGAKSNAAEARVDHAGDSCLLSPLCPLKEDNGFLLDEWWDAIERWKGQWPLRVKVCTPELSNVSQSYRRDWFDMRLGSRFREMAIG